MATQSKDFKVKNGLQVGDSTNLVNYTSASPSDPFVGQLWISASSLYAWSSASTWVLIGDGGSASGTPLNIPNTLVSRNASGIFTVGGVDLDLSGTVALGVGRLQWNSSFGTPEIGLIGGNVTAHIGQHLYAYVTNAEGSPLVKGDVVYLFGASGDRASVKKAINTGDPTSSKTLGVVAEAIATGGQGFVTEFGVVDKLNLSAYSPGDILWLSASAGKFTNIKPSAPNHTVFIGVVQRANAGNGLLFVNVQNGYELGELHDVSATNALNNDILSYNQSASLWVSQNLATAIQEVDGAGSGIDADLLDGQDSTYFMPASASSTFDEVTYTADPPSSPNVGDIWVESDVDVSLQTYHAAYSASAPTEPIVGDLWVDSSQNIELTLTPSTASAIYLRQDTASAQYLSKTDASNTYFPMSSSGSLLTETEASAIYAPLSSPSLTGVPLAPTAASGTNTTQIATTEFVRTEVAGLVDSAPSTLDTLNELATALGDDPNFATTVTNSLSSKLDASTASTLFLGINDTANHANTASSINLSNITGFGSNVLTFLQNPTSSNLISAVPEETGSGSLVFNVGPTIFSPVLIAPEERCNVVASTATGTINFDVLTATIWYYTSNATGNHTLNIRGNSTNTLNSIMNVGDSISIVWINTNGSTPYWPSVVQIDSSNVSPKWAGGTAPSGGNASSIDGYTYTIIKTAATPTYVVFAGQTKFA